MVVISFWGRPMVYLQGVIRDEIAASQPVGSVLFELSKTNWKD